MPRKKSSEDLQKRPIYMEDCVNGWRYTDGGVLLLPIIVKDNGSVRSRRYLLMERAVLKYVREYGLVGPGLVFNYECLRLIRKDLEKAIGSWDNKPTDLGKQKKKGWWIKGKDLLFYVYGGYVKNLKLSQKYFLRRKGREKRKTLGAIYERRVSLLNLRQES